MLEKSARNRKRPAAAKPAGAGKKTAPAGGGAPIIKTVSDAAAPGIPRAGVSPEQRWRMIAESAYYRAQRRGFRGDPVKDWVEAEAEIDASFLNRR
jgi:hypothetical protein